ncbi:hypothetical protein BT96DRAFT_177905 [Gymnopus androsaceus JB14]|uniref:DUF6534 domain-containing protein n=1 Tax=Gymnopus androsaceus JB14 TaxID=1447944 RepID=A0A6A4H9W6_9AGAR|nr:hypothetical protein BT96DRAFT_177905 [Gymnopus androsaceus JB14]
MSGLSAAEHAQINISLGGVVISNYLSYLTMGVVLSSTWTYFSKFPTDRWWFKAVVILCVSLCIGDTVADGIWVYDWAVANYANPAALAFHWALPAEPFLSSTCALIVQLFYAWRLWVMSMRMNWILPIAVGSLSILGWCMIFRIVVSVAMAPNLMQSEFAFLLPECYVWLGASAGADVLITSSMIYYLDLRFRVESQQNKISYLAPRRFRRIIVRTLECNLLSLLAQAIVIGLLSQISVGLYFLIPEKTLAKVYTFSLLLYLNSRPTDNDRGSTKKSLSPYGGGDVEFSSYISFETLS